jgi:hypothetical protein
MRAQPWDAVVKDYTDKGLIDPSRIPPYSQEALQQVRTFLLSRDKKWELEHPKPLEVSAGASLMSPTGQVLGTAPKPEEHSPAYRSRSSAGWR